MVYTFVSKLMTQHMSHSNDVGWADRSEKLIIQRMSHSNAARPHYVKGPLEYSLSTIN